MTRYLDATLSSVGACMNQRQGVPSNLKLITTTINEECKAGEGINNTLMQVCVCEMYALVEFTLQAASLQGHKQPLVEQNPSAGLSG